MGGWEVPIGALWNLVTRLLDAIPLPYRSQYLSSVIHVAFVSVEDETQLLVYRGVGGSGGSVSARVLRKTAETKTVSQMNELIRDAAFMILELQEGLLPGRTWKALRRFSDGQEALSEFQRTAEQAAWKTAKENFLYATQADGGLLEAAYFYASMLVGERTAESVDTAIVFFERVLQSGNAALRAFAHAGLARCYSQQWHRLARREPDVLEKAYQHAEDAHAEYSGQGDHAWLLGTSGLVRIVNEGSRETRAEDKKRFIEGGGFMLRAMKLDPSNDVYPNNLGWVLLKLAEWDPEGDWEILPGDEAPSEFLGNPAEVAEKYLRRSVHLNHRNKLPHANRCLLYATAYFRKKKDNELFLDKARASGREALRLDPRYINGHRDLAMSLLRYRQFDEAYEYSAKALRLADNPEKRHELRQDLLAVFDELKARPDANAADEEQQSRWEQSLARAIAGLNQERDPPPPLRQPQPQAASTESTREPEGS